MRPILSRHIPAAKPSLGGLQAVVGGDDGANKLHFGLLSLGRGETHTAHTGVEEVALVLLGGHCDIHVAGKGWSDLGSRKTVFGGAPFAAYLPKEMPFEVTGARAGCEIAWVSAPARTRYRPCVVTPDQLADVGMGTSAPWQVEAREVIGVKVQADRLMVAETYSQPGHGSWCPFYEPAPAGTGIASVAHYRFFPGHGFAFQWVGQATAGAEGPSVVRERDSTVFLRSQLPVVIAAPGYRLYTLWALAADGRHRVAFGAGRSAVGA